VLAGNKEFFGITSVARADLEELGFDASGLELELGLPPSLTTHFGATTGGLTSSGL
jgi:hypothetical protein